MTTKANKEAKRQRREAAREERLKERQRLEARRRRRDLMIYGAVAVVVVAILGTIAWSAFRPKPGVAIQGQGREHIAPGTSHPPYNSNPPTSGWHHGTTAPVGVHRAEIADETLIHNLEHGCVWISYKDPSDTALVEKIEALAARYARWVIVTPRAKNDSAIAAAAWERLLKLEQYDERQLEEFIRTFRNKGPEAVNCSAQSP